MRKKTSKRRREREKFAHFGGCIRGSVARGVLFPPKAYRLLPAGSGSRLFEIRKESALVCLAFLASYLCFGAGMVDLSTERGGMMVGTIYLRSIVPDA
ncbi:unnamed protein product [Victoria cruziana]